MKPGLPFAIALVTGVAACVAGNAPAPPPGIPVFEDMIDLEIGEVEGEIPTCSRESVPSWKTNAGG